MKALRIILIGYGKMGKAIETVALAKGHTVILKISSQNKHELTAENLQSCDVAIEFTDPQSAVGNVLACIDAGLPVVCGSTGWHAREEELKQYCLSHNGSFLNAGNFSIGVNLFFELNKKLASLMNGRPEYTAGIKEIHHTQKKDAPSGTAIMLAKQIIAENDATSGWAHNGETAAGNIEIESIRRDPAPGTHHVTYSSGIDDIEIIHTAHSRQGFAAGAVIAAEFLWNKKGIYHMSDVLNAHSEL